MIHRQRPSFACRATSAHRGNTMPSIAFYATTREMMRLAQKALQKDHSDIRVVTGKPGGGGSDLAAKLAEQGVDVIIARGGKATDIRAAGLPVVVVDLRISSFDLIAAVHKAKTVSRRIAAVAFPNMIDGIERLAPVLDADIRVYPLSRREDPGHLLRRAVAEGAQVVIGGPVTISVARPLNIPAVLLENDGASIVRAAQEAKRIAEARRQERARSGMWSALLDYSYEGMVSIDGEGRIFAFNPVAERVLGVSKEQAVGREIARIWPGLGLEKVLASGKDQLAQMLRVNGADVLCNKIAIRVGEKPLAAVATFQDSTDIQRMEERVRRRIYASGYTATLNFSAIRGKSQSIRRVIDMAAQFAATSSSVLILGETGSGKELFAQGIHNSSPRRGGPFVPINCAAVPGELLESELFGYTGGAFTGANPKGKLGLFEQAHNGTLFLDEVAEMNLSLQGKLLRALQERTIMRLGSDRVIHVDVRVIAATNQDIKRCVEERSFRPDLYYRLNVLRLRVPPLRERAEDIPELARFFLGEASRSGNGPTLSDAALQALGQYSWPGNVRELQSFMERIAALHKEGVIGADLVRMLWADEELSPSGPLPLPPVPDDEADSALLLRALRESNYKASLAAQRLGISRSTLWRRLKKHGLQR